MSEEIMKSVSEICGEYVKDKYAMYLRKSRADLELEAMGEEETLARHKKMLFNLAAKHNISENQITIYHEIVSGESIDERPEMQRLISDVWEKKYKGVLVVEVERLARGNTKDQGEVAEAFQMSDTTIVTPMKTYDPHNEYDQEYFEFGLFMSRREYKTIRRRMENGKRESVAEGNYILPQRIFGFDIKRIDKKTRILVEKPEESKILHMIFDWYTEELKSPEWISQQLTKMGVPTLKNKPEWSRGTIRDMLCNLHYIGKVTWGDQKTVKKPDPITGKIIKKRVNTGNPKIYDGKHKGIISEEQFNKALEITKSNSKPPVKFEHALKNPLAGLLVCADCGSTLTVYDPTDSPSRKKWNTTPRFVHQNKLKCKKKSLPIDLIFDSFVDALNAYIDDFQIKIENGNDQSELIRHQETIKVMEKELQNQENRKRKLMDSWEAEDGMYTRDEFIERKQMYLKNIEKLKGQIETAKKEAPEPVDYSEQIFNLHSMIDCIKNPDLDAKAKNDFLKQFIDRITYDAIDFGRNKGGKPILDVYLK